MVDVEASGWRRSVNDLANKTIVVTGGCGILGSVVCEHLLDFGATVVVLDVEASDPVGFGDALSDSHVGRGVWVCDGFVEHGLTAAVVRPDCQRSRVPDGLVNAAATKGGDLEAFLQPVDQYEESTWRDVMAVNIDGLFFLTQAIGRRWWPPRVVARLSTSHRSMGISGRTNGSTIGPSIWGCSCRLRPSTARRKGPCSA